MENEVLQQVDYTDFINQIITAINDTNQILRAILSIFIVVIIICLCRYAYKLFNIFF